MSEENKKTFEDFSPSARAILDLFEFIEDKDNAKSLGLKGAVYTYNRGTSPIKFGDGWELVRETVVGGGEGDGELHYVVFKLTQHGINPTYWMVPGWYQSYNGAELEWSDMYQCEPYQKAVTDYRKV